MNLTVLIIIWLLLQLPLGIALTKFIKWKTVSTSRALSCAPVQEEPEYR